MKARAKWLEDCRLGLIAGHRDPSVPAGKGVNGTVNGYHGNGDIKKLKSEDSVDDEATEVIHPQPYETERSNQKAIIKITNCRGLEAFISETLCKWTSTNTQTGLFHLCSV